MDRPIDGLAAPSPCHERACSCACHVPAPAELLGAYGIDPGALTPTEVRLAASLLPPGRRVGAVELLRRAWGPGFAAADNAERQALRTALSRLRPKLGRRFRIELVGRGRGWRLRREFG